MSKAEWVLKIQTREERKEMKLKDFEELKSGAKVMIRRRRARLEGSPRISGGYGSTKEYGWAHFRYLDTKRLVTKRHRQVEPVQEKDLDERAKSHACMLGYPDPSDIEAGKEGGESLCLLKNRKRC